MKLSDTDVESALQELQGWRREGHEIVADLSFAAYKDGLVFASAVGWLADRADHHPDLFIGYRKVQIRLSSHDAGGVTQRDLNMARKIDALAG